MSGVIRDWNFVRAYWLVLMGGHEFSRVDIVHPVLSITAPVPLWTVRLMGPMGAELIKRVRMDLISNFMHVLDDAPSTVANYIFHCNVQKPTTGESAFHCMMVTFGWAKNPLCHRLHLLHPEIPMTLIYGSRSWVDHFPAEKIRNIRSSSYVGYHVLVAGHHVYADSYEAFNEVIVESCKVERPIKEDVPVPIPPPPTFDAEPLPPQIVINQDDASVVEGSLSHKCEAGCSRDSREF